MSDTQKFHPLQLLPITSDSDAFVVYLERALRAMAPEGTNDLYFEFKPLSGAFPDETFRLTYDPLSPRGWAWFNTAYPYQRTICKSDFSPFWSKGEKELLREAGYTELPFRRWNTAPTAVQSVMESGIGGLLRVFASTHRAPGASGFLPGYVYTEAPPASFTLFLPTVPLTWNPCHAVSELGVEHLPPEEGDESRFSCSGVYVPAAPGGLGDSDRCLDIVILPETT